MTASRREFIRHVGIALASMMMVRCTASPGAKQPDPSPTPECGAFEAAGDSPCARLRSCWASLTWLADQAQADLECGDRASETLLAAHRTALDDLARSGELGTEAGSYVHTAFEEAVHHIWRSNVPISCYESAGPAYRYASRDQLATRARVLDDMASSGSIAPESVAQVQAALERDIAYLNLSEQAAAPYERLVAGSDYPSYAELDLEIAAPAAEAARFLVRVLLQH
jgi:hypothetical protein